MQYSDQYIEQTFLYWYNGGRKISQKFANSIPEDERGERPTFKAIEKWRDTYGWMERADVLDAELSRALQDQVINERIAMYKEHVQVADSLIEKGKTYLNKHEIDGMSDALKAISLGVEIHRVSVGQVALGQKILSMNDDQLTKELNRLLSPKSNEDEFIDVTPEDADES